MKDTAAVRLSDSSAEDVAYKLLKTIASNEGKTLETNMSGAATADRKWLLDTYAECIKAVRFGSRPK